jgi:hypothetical protein
LLYQLLTYSNYLPPLPGEREGALPPPLLLLPELEPGLTLGADGALLLRSKVRVGLLSLLLSTERRGLVLPEDDPRGFT